ncbi:MAG TPA: hypothetical protein PLB70_11300, partial [Paludibacteraceae bacterium]|nr:hypothetical protein [Paludibacteraceae bacterium]
LFLTTNQQIFIHFWSEIFSGIIYIVAKQMRVSAFGVTCFQQANRYFKIENQVDRNFNYNFFSLR